MKKLSHRRKRLNWRQAWQQLTAAQQQRVRSFAWSASLHMCVLAVLLLIPISIQKLNSVEITGVFAGEDVVEVFSFESPMELEQELVHEEIETVEPTVVALDDLAQMDIAPLELTSLQPVSSTPSLSTIEPVQGDGGGAGVGSDDHRVQETNRRVAAAGGELEGPVRVSLMFSGDDDIDLHVQYQPTQGTRPMLGMGRYIFFGSPRSEHAALDVDANASVVHPKPVENVIFRTVPAKATYTVGIHHFRVRGYAEPVPYVVTIKYGSKIKVFEGVIRPFDGLKQIWQFQYAE